MAVIVLRLGHRKSRDKRVSTHCGLVARAFGAQQVIYSGEQDDNLVNSVNNLCTNWGGNFSARYESNWLAQLRQFKASGGVIAHLTMYGIPFEKVISQIRKKVFAQKGKKENKKPGKKSSKASGKNLLIVIGAEKVPGIVYELAGYNVGVTSQPHSEVAALAVFLYGLFLGRKKDFSGARLKIRPVARGKRVSRAHG